LPEKEAKKTIPMINALEENIGNWDLKLEI
jgi:hypothetical protein